MCGNKRSAPLADRLRMVQVITDCRSLKAILVAFRVRFRGALLNIVLYSTELAIQLARLLKEELLVNEDQNYRAYAARVRYRLIPLIF